MPTGSTELANELKTLRKGRGLQAPKLTEQVGPLLLRLCGAGGTENSAAIREKLSERLRILSDRLPDDLRLAVTTVSLRAGASWAWTEPKAEASATTRGRGRQAKRTRRAGARPLEKQAWEVIE